jgi:hypothetical protein
MRGLLQPETCAMLAVPTLGLWHTAYRPFLRRVARFVNRTASDAFRDLPDAAHLSALISRRLLEDIVALPRGGQRTAFRIPDHLAQSWGIASRGVRATP